VLRHLIVAMTEAATTPSPMMKEEKSRSIAPRAPAAAPAPAAPVAAPAAAPVADAAPAA
jgi:small subunit ribosomal protein S6